MTMNSRIRPIIASSVMAAAIVVMMVEPAFAQAAGIESVLQNIVTMLTGNIAKLLAVIAVIVICIAWMFGYTDVLMRPIALCAIGIAALYVFYQLPSIASALASGGASLAYGYGTARDAHEGMLARGTSYTGRMIGRGARVAGRAFGSRNSGA